MTWHYSTVHYITLHCITLHYITVQYSTVHYITLHYLTLHYITLHYIKCVGVHCVALHRIAWHGMALHNMTWHYVHTYFYIYIFIYLYVYRYVYIYMCLCVYIYVKYVIEGVLSMGVSQNHQCWPVLHHKPSILGYPILWTPYNKIDLKHVETISQWQHWFPVLVGQGTTDGNLTKPGRGDVNAAMRSTDTNRMNSA